MCGGRYKGVGQAFTDMLGGDAMLSASPVEIKPYLNAGKVKPLAVSGRARSPQLPGAPTIAETLSSPLVITINGLVAAADVPQEVVGTLSREIVTTEKRSDFAKRIQALGVEPIVSTPAQVAKVIASATDLWRDAVRDLGLKTQ